MASKGVEDPMAGDNLTSDPGESQLQPAGIGWPTGNGKKLSCTQACCLAQLCLAEA